MDAATERGDSQRPLSGVPAPVPSGPPGSKECAEAREVAAELAGLGIMLDPATEEALALYLRRIRQWSERINLVSAHDVERLGRRHLLESFNVLACPFPLAGARLADAGSGAGFPGIPLALIEPTLEVLLIESVRKKAAFLSRMVAELGLAPSSDAAPSPEQPAPSPLATSPEPLATSPGPLATSPGPAYIGSARATSAGGAGPPPPGRIIVAAERAEALALAPEHRSRYGIVTVRGFGPLSRAVRECGALLAPGGFLVAFKGTSPEREVRDALGAMKGREMALTDIAPMRWGEGCLVLLRRKGAGDSRS